VIPIWLERAARGLDLELYGGAQVLDLIPVGFVVEALLRAADADSWPGPINVASGRGTPLTDLAQQVLSLTGAACRAVFLPAREEEVIGFVADVSLLKRDLGLEPPPPLERLPQLVASYKEACAGAL
jgi:nucleoside-diphosphate-sugar epimerase